MVLPRVPQHGLALTQDGPSAYVEHVVQERYLGVSAAAASSIQVERHLDLRLLRFSFESAYPICTTTHPPQQLPFLCR